MTDCKQTPTIRVGRAKLIFLAIWLALILLSTAWTALNRSSHLTYSSSPSISWRYLPPPIGGGMVRHVVVVDQRWGRIYVLGGKTGNITSDKVYYASLLTDGAITGWSSSDMPAKLYSAAGVANQGWIFMAGGYDDTNGVYTSSVYSAHPDPSTGWIARWDSKSNLPISVANHNLVTYGDYLYSVGGQTAVGSATPALANVYYASFDRVSGNVDPWIATTSLLTPTAGHAAVVHNGKLYIVGGFTKNTSGVKSGLSAVVYGTINTGGSINGWASTAPLPISLYQHAALVSGDYIYVIGGYDDTNKILSSAVYRAPIRANGALGDWEEVSQTIRHNLRLSEVCQGAVFVQFMAIR